MKYKDINIKLARLCCKKHKINCDKCPLRREETKNGKLLKYFCWFTLYEIEKEIKEEKQELEKMNICYEKEWQEWLEAVIKTEK